jgi:hypothetical protein
MRRKFNDALPKNAPKNNKALIGLMFCKRLFILEDKFKELTSEDRL